MTSTVTAKLPQSVTDSINNIKALTKCICSDKYKELGYHESTCLNEYSKDVDNLVGYLELLEIENMIAREMLNER